MQWSTRIMTGANYPRDYLPCLCYVSCFGCFSHYPFSVVHCLAAACATWTLDWFWWHWCSSRNKGGITFGGVTKAKVREGETLHVPGHDRQIMYVPSLLTWLRQQRPSSINPCSLGRSKFVVEIYSKFYARVLAPQIRYEHAYQAAQYTNFRGALVSVDATLFEATHLMGAGFMIWNRNVDCFQRSSRPTSFGTSPSCIYLIKFSNPDDQLMPSLKKMM
jgi:hypothetical protein